jgi:uncharacterized protein involved in exopolysaccharide biosynthesis
MEDTRPTSRSRLHAENQTTRDIVSIFFFKKHVFLFTFFSLVIAALLVSFLFPPIYQTSGKLLVKPQIETPMLFDAESTKVSMENRVDPQVLNTILHLITMDTVAKQVVLKHHLADPEDPKAMQKAVESLIGSLKAEPLATSNVIEISMKGGDPDEVAALLNTYIDEFINYHIQMNQSIHGRLEFFDQQTKTFQDRYAELTSQLAQESQKLQVLNPELQTDNELKLIKDLELLYTEKVGRIKALQERLHMLEKVHKDLLDEGHMASLTEDLAASYPALVEMQRSLAQMIINIQRARNDFRASSKPVRDAETQYANMKQQIHRQIGLIIRNTRDLITSRTLEAQELAKRVRVAQQQVTTLKGNTIAIEQLQLEQKLAQDNYTLYGAKREEARINLEKNRALFANISIASRPSKPLYPWFPQKRKLLLIAIIVAFVLGLGAAVTAYALDHKIRTPHDIIARTELRFLGSLDYLGSKA